MQSDTELRRTVIESLPELDEIRDESLRSKVIDAWTYSLNHSTFKSIEEIRASGNPDTAALKSGTQTDHIRGVTRLAMAIADEMARQFPQLPINRDLLIACALCHDVGKPYEFDPPNQQRWKEQPGASGFPAIRHTQYGTHVCLTIGLPEEVCHAAGCHSGEGELVQRSLHVTIIHHADHAWWLTLAAADQLQAE
jgi:putative nucleotidyltransferase with HDIG domain